MTELDARIDPGDQAEAADLLAAHAPTALVRGSESRLVCVRRWSGWSILALEKLPLPYAWTVALLGLAAIGEQVLEYWIEDPTFESAAAMGVGRGLVLPLLIVYILAHLHILKRATVDALADLRGAVLVDDQEYEARVRDMVCPNPRTEAILLACSTLLVLLLFVGLQADLLNANKPLPSLLPAAVLIVVMYILLGWLLLTLVYTSIRQAGALFLLARRPLRINVFDPAELLPFGRLSMIQSLPVVGVLLIPMILFGMPTSGGYLVVLISAVSLLALFVPLWGVHEQIDQAKEKALAIIYEQLHQVQAEVLVDLDVEIPNFARLSDRTGLMLKLRETIHESSNWPFKDTAAVARAIAAVTSPLVYFILNELIRAYLFPILGGGGAP